MFNPQLFLGFPLTPELEAKLAKANPHAVSLFISTDLSKNSDYLHQVDHENGKYLGKLIGEITPLETIEQFTSNIRSIASKLVEEHNFSDHPTILFALPPQGSPQS